MKAYFKNGKTIRISQKLANEIVDMITSNDGKNVLISKHFISENVFAYFDITKIIAIK